MVDMIELKRDAHPWLLLVHRLPSGASTLRVRVWRRLQALGAVAVRDAVHVLPATEQTREDVQWVAQEVVAGGGDAWIFAATLLGGVSDDEVVASFRAARRADYEALAADIDAEASSMLGLLADGAQTERDERARLERLRRRHEAIRSIDFFSADGGERAAAGLARLETLIEARLSTEGSGEVGSRGRALRPRGATWVTRRGIGVDRIASAWLIARFIDAEARFAYVDPHTHQHRERELRFDMYAGEFTHRGECCTFEVLCEEFALDSPALARLGEMVHDLDLKDGRYGHPECTGLALLISGIVASYPDDESRRLRGIDLFDTLYAGLGP